MTETRTGAAGYPFCFLQINEETAIKFCESEAQIGLHHYGFVTDDVEQAAREFLAKGAKITRENRNAAGRLTAVFLRDPSGLDLEIR